MLRALSQALPVSRALPQALPVLPVLLVLRAVRMAWMVRAATMAPATQRRLVVMATQGAARLLQLCALWPMTCRPRRLMPHARTSPRARLVCVRRRYGMAPRRQRRVRVRAVAGAASG